MACSGEFGIWIVPQRNGKELNQFKIYVNPNDTIYKIKQKVAERTKTEEKRFCLFKSDHTELEDDKTVKDCNIRSGDRLKKVEDKEPYKKTRSNTGPDSVPPSPYVRSDSVTSSPYVRPLIKANRRHQMRKSNSDTTFNKKDPKGSTNDTGQQKKLPQDKTVLLEDYITESQENKKSSQTNQTDLPIEKVIPTEQKPDNITGDEKSENSFPRDIKTAPLPAKEDYCKQSESEKQLRRPRTADAKFIFIQSQRLLSTLNMRTSSMNDLTKLDTELKCNEQLKKALEIADSKRNDESRKLTEVLRLFYGDLVEAMTDPELVSSRLYQEGLITFTEHKNTSTLGWTDSSKANKLLKHVNIQLMTRKRPLEVLKSFGKVIHVDPLLSTFIPKIEKHISCAILPRQPSPIRDVRVISAGSFKKCRGECLVSQDDIPNLLYRTAVDCQHKWYLMGSLLGLSTEELNHIGKIHSNSPGNCYADMISRYVCSKQLLPTWHLITKYLMQPLEQYDLGMLFRKEYCKDCCYIEDELKYEN